MIRIEMVPLDAAGGSSYLLEVTEPNASDYAAIIDKNGRLEAFTDRCIGRRDGCLAIDTTFDLKDLPNPWGIRPGGIDASEAGSREWNATWEGSQIGMNEQIMPSDEAWTITYETPADRRAIPEGRFVYDGNGSLPSQLVRGGEVFELLSFEDYAEETVDREPLNVDQAAPRTTQGTLFPGSDQPLMSPVDPERALKEMVARSPEMEQLMAEGACVVRYIEPFEKNRSDDGLALPERDYRTFVLTTTAAAQAFLGVREVDLLGQETWSVSKEVEATGGRCPTEKPWTGQMGAMEARAAPHVLDQLTQLLGLPEIRSFGWTNSPLPGLQPAPGAAAGRFYATYHPTQTEPALARLNDRVAIEASSCEISSTRTNHELGLEFTLLSVGSLCEEGRPRG